MPALKPGTIETEVWPLKLDLFIFLVTDQYNYCDVWYLSSSSFISSIIHVLVDKSVNLDLLLNILVQENNAPQDLYSNNFKTVSSCF